MFVHGCYSASLVLSYFRLTKDRVMLFRPEIITKSFLHLMSLFAKWSSNIFQNTILWCFLLCVYLYSLVVPTSIIYSVEVWITGISHAKFGEISFVGLWDIQFKKIYMVPFLLQMHWSKLKKYFQVINISYIKFCVIPSNRYLYENLKK